MKLNVFCFCEPHQAQTVETLSKSMSMSFLILLNVLSGVHFGSKFGRHSFSANLFISKVFFPSTSCIFVFTITTIFALDSRQQYPFMHKCNSMLNTLSLIANQNMSLPLAMRFYIPAFWQGAEKKKIVRVLGGNCAVKNADCAGLHNRVNKQIFDHRAPQKNRHGGISG